MFHVNPLPSRGLAEDSLETSSLIFSEKNSEKNIYECRLLLS